MTATRPALAYAIGPSRLGLLLAAVGERGVAAVLIGDDAAGLRRALHAAFPSEPTVADTDAAGAALAAAARLIDDPHAAFPLPLDLRGSAVELAVWTALRTIPAGETRSYGQVAQALPVRATAQEVGAACAANRIAIVVPCHRVVKADGGLAGYRWGVHRKRRLINLEAVA